MTVKIPRLAVAGLSGDSGKTVVTLAILSALKRRGLTVAPFKKGPDYIDAAWLSTVSNYQCRNLDEWLVSRDRLLNTFIKASHNVDIAVIEGNRGLYDGKDAAGKYSTAELAKNLKTPLVLIVDATKSTRTVAALVKGCLDFDPDLNIAGVIINRVAGQRHEQVIREAIETYCKLPIVGVIPKLGEDQSLIPGRHLGLITPAEFKANSRFLSRLDEIADKYLNIDKLIEIARTSEPLDIKMLPKTEQLSKKVNIGFFNDPIFTFYYPENLEALEIAGARLIPISSIDDKELPEDIDALYIGGGFPETQAEKLIRNQTMMQSVCRAAKNGLPVYAECGGLIYLSKSILWHDKEYPMAGLFPVKLKMNKKPVGHGYTILKVKQANPFFNIGEEIKGHEFHYSSPVEWGDEVDTIMQVTKGAGIINQRDGLYYNNCLALYTHIHADGVTSWAPSLIEIAEKYKNTQREGQNGNFSLAV